MNITNRGWVFIALLILGGLFGAYTVVKNKYGKELTAVKEKSQLKAALGSAHVYTIGINTWPGWAGGVTFNNGFKANIESQFYKKYGFAVELKVIDNINESRAAFKSGQIDMLWCTADALPNEEETGTGLASPEVESKFVFQSDWSRGGDAIVCTKNINTVADLKGKSIAFAEMSPSHSLLINTLDAGGLSMTDVTLVKAGDASVAAEEFKAGKVDVAVVWSPDDKDCITTIAGAKVLVSTKNATNIIADGFLVKKSFLAEHDSDLTNLVTGWLTENSIINASSESDPNSEKHKAAKLLAAGGMGTESWAYDGLGKVRLATIGDNRQFFGLDEGAPVTAPQLYTRMAVIYKQLGYVKDPLPWKLVGETSLLEHIKTPPTGTNAPEGGAVFTKATPDVVKSVATASKPITINFASGQYQLDNSAKNVIDQDFVPNAKQFGRNAYIRIEGNTDNVGGHQANVNLSTQRANAVKDYLMKSYGWAAERFIVVGNGPDKPLCTDVADPACLAKNRRTDFELVLQK